MVAFSKGRGVSKGGKSLFAMESKTFEIPIEGIRGNRWDYSEKEQRLLLIDKIW